MNNILEGFGTVKKIKALMAASGMNMQDVANVMGVSLGTVGNRFEHNDWSVAEIKTLAEKFAVEPADLI
jgi:antitoxin component HigA of HigAB toxin-antitoxin module